MNVEGLDFTEYIFIWQLISFYQGSCIRFSEFFLNIIHNFVFLDTEDFFHQVTRVSDVLSVGQQLSLMCIGQDVRGNIKLSLKATVSQRQSETNDVVEGSAPSMKEAPKYWASAENVVNEQEGGNATSEELSVKNYEVGRAKPSTSSIPSILIRSAAECEEEEKSAGLIQHSRSTSLGSGDSKADHKSKTLSQKSQKFLDTEVEDHVTAKSLKLGTKVTAKVYQIRARGLVLDLGGGLRGMYRFEVCVIFLFYATVVYMLLCLII